MIILENTKSVDLNKLIAKIHFAELDFSIITSLKGDKKILEQAFQDIKKELI